MKGVFPIFIFALLGVSILVGIIATNILLEGQTIKRSVRDSIILEAINKVEFLKNSLNQALAYSFYQSSFELARSGGSAVSNSNEPPIYYWIENGAAQFPDYLGNTKQRMISVLNQYVGEMQVGGITNPDYDASGSQISEHSRNILRVDATSSEKIMSSADRYMIEDSSSMTTLVQSRFLYQFENAKEAFVDQNLVQQFGDEILASWPTRGSLRRTCYRSSCGGCSISTNSVFSSVSGYSLPRAENIMESEMQDKVDQFESNYWLLISDPANFAEENSNFNTEITDESYDADINARCTTSTSCSFRPLLGLYRVRTTKSCDFSYTLTSDIQMQITNNQYRYPVYDGLTTERRPIALRFGIEEVSRWG